ncbi:MAG: hypothetical protein QM532_04500 [Cyanobium sp. MAG06]|nr:hypothetical protein [Cyanobium sp. MAG06]
MHDKEINNNINNIKYECLSYDFLLENISNSITLSEDDKNKLEKAYNISKKYHSSQLRNSGEPYINHCI